MFRPLRRKNNAISEEDTKKLLSSEKRGIIAVNGDDGYPYAIPVDYLYDKEENRIYFHGAKAGHKIDSLKKDDKVCFTVYGNEHYIEGEWAPCVQSAVIFGRCHLIDDLTEVEKRVRELAGKYYPSQEEIEEGIRTSLKNTQLYQVTIEHMSGKQIKEK